MTRDPPAPGPLRFYSELADWWPLMSPPEEYAEEAAFYLGALTGACARAPRTLLELGSGGGSNALHMKGAFQEVVLTDLSPAMLEVSRALNPDCAHHQGDMRTLRLGREFDCVFVHDAVAYMATEDDLRAAIRTAWLHCAPGGAALFAPDYLRDTFRPGTAHGGTDVEGRAMRFLEWSWDPDPEDRACTVDYVFVLREADGSIRLEHDRHQEGLFSRAEWLRWLEEAGFRAEAVPFEHSELEPGSHEVFLCRRPPEAR